MIKPTISQKALVIVRAGRKRKSTAKRHPNGDIAEERKQKEDAHLIAFRMPHRQSVPADKRFDQKAGTSLGRLHLRGILTEEQYEAGRKYSDRVGLYRASIEAPRAGESIAGIFEPHSGRPISIDAAIEIKERYDAAFESMHNLSRAIVKTVNRIAVHDEECPHWLVDMLTTGLDTLAEHFRLTERRKS